MTAEGRHTDNHYCWQGHLGSWGLRQVIRGRAEDWLVTVLADISCCQCIGCSLACWYFYIFVSTVNSQHKCNNLLLPRATSQSEN